MAELIEKVQKHDKQFAEVNTRCERRAAAQHEGQLSTTGILAELQTSVKYLLSMITTIRDDIHEIKRNGKANVT